MRRLEIEGKEQIQKALKDIGLTLEEMIGESEDEDDKS